MRIGGNSLAQLHEFYISELAGLYDRGEADAIFRLVTEHFTGEERSAHRKDRERRFSESELLKFYDCCRELKKGRPVQYVLGEAWFHGLRLKVNEAVLIPRPETEELVDLVIRENRLAKSFLDLCTGSGCVPLAIAKSISAKVSGCDISPEALAIARENAFRLKLDAGFFQADVLAGELEADPSEVIVSNPPYVRESERDSLAPQVLLHEPQLALFAPGDGLIFYRKIADICVKTLLPGGRLYLELNPLAAEEVRSITGSTGQFNEVMLIKDMSGKTRFLKAVKKE